VNVIPVLLLDASNSEAGQLALSSLAFIGTIVAAVIGGFVLSYIKSNRARAQSDVAQLGLQIAAECDARRAAIDSEVKERQQAINNEGDIRRTKDEELGRDISRIRERLAYDRGQAKKPYPGDD
jgi:hypothetical protein